MEIYKQRSWWKLLLGIGGIAIIIITLLYSNYLAQELEKSEQKNQLIYLKAFEESQDLSNLNQDIGLMDTILQAFDLPVILEDEDGNLISEAWSPEENEDQEFLNRKKQEFLDAGKKPIEGTGYARYSYFFNSKLRSQITYFPIIQALMVAMFIALGYYLFSTSRKAEQNRVWAGMAKETAHQLGTPISAIIAWIEHLKLNAENDPDQQEIIQELRSDVGRLELIADRFSKIGSAPKLQSEDIYEQLEHARKYMQRRASKRMKFDFQTSKSPLLVQINPHLFSWVIENLIRNALDAMGSEGTIATEIYTENNYVCIDLSDTGKGIASSQLKTVFQPGFTTKKRGWGLGLSLAKRIIEEYHQGKIYVKQSKLEEGTTFTIKLLKV